MGLFCTIDPPAALTLTPVPGFIAEAIRGAEKRMQRAVLSAIVIGVLAGCTGAAEKEAAQLSLACQMQRCDCISNTFLFVDSEPVLWKLDGTAYCRDGYHLRRLEPKPSRAI